MIAPQPPFFVAAAGALTCAVTDARSGYIFDAVTGPTLCATLAVASFCGSAAPSAAGACLLGLLFLAVRTATRGRGLGLGDVKLAACIGAGLGIAGGLWSVGIASVGAGLYGVALLALGRAQPKTAIPFGPFLAAGCLAAGGYACFR